MPADDMKDKNMKPQDLHRRTLLRAGAWATAGALLPVGRQAWAAGPAADATDAADAADAARGGPRLVVVFLRGAVDGLSLVAPWSEPAYRRLRPGIALPAPGKEGGLLDLDGHFGLHPALAPLLPRWQAGQLAFIHASGSPDPTRSHFDAQDYMESATPGRKATPDGWMNRLLDVLPAAGGVDAPTRGMSLGPVLPRIFSGPHPVAMLGNGAAGVRPGLLDRPRVEQAFDGLYGGDDAMSRAYRESRQASKEVRQTLAASASGAGMAGGMAGGMDAEMMAANNGAPLPGGFPDDAARIGTLMRRDPRVQLAFLALGGWDTHVRQGSSTGQLAQRLSPLGQGLAALAQRLGPVYDDTVIVVMSEFGRTARENGTGGTDHGHGNVMTLLGGRVAGGRVLGRWPGMDEAALHEGRDLAVTTDFRQVLAGLATQHLRLPDAALARLLPAAPEGSPLNLMRTA